MKAWPQHCLKNFCHDINLYMFIIVLEYFLTPKISIMPICSQPFLPIWSVLIPLQLSLYSFVISRNQFYLFS